MAYHTTDGHGLRSYLNWVTLGLWTQTIPLHLLKELPICIKIYQKLDENKYISILQMAWFTADKLLAGIYANQRCCVNHLSLH